MNGGRIDVRDSEKSWFGIFSVVVRALEVEPNKSSQLPILYHYFSYDYSDRQGPIMSAGGCTNTDPKFRIRNYGTFTNWDTLTDRSFYGLCSHYLSFLRRHECIS